ncbi:MAG: hypothetical protein ACTHMM_17725 [Agriterribacter sp.]
MEILENLLSFLKALGVDWTLVFIYWLGGTFITTFFVSTWRIPFTRYCVTGAWRTLLIGTMLIALWLRITYGPIILWTQEIKKTVFISYLFTTSMYELFLKDTLDKWLKKAKVWITGQKTIDNE